MRNVTCPIKRAQRARPPKILKRGTPALSAGIPRLHAVAVGFEPTEGCPSRAFEARSFGRSDTPPRRTIPDAPTGPNAVLSLAKKPLVFTLPGEDAATDHRGE